MITPADYVLNLGVGDVSPHGARNNSFSLLPMSVPVSCTDEEKQAMFFWLNHGLVWIYAFNHEEAIECFQRALDISPLCIFAHWGIALSHGPNYNSVAMCRDNFPSGIEAYTHAAKVTELLKDSSVAAYLTPVQLSLLSSLSCRFNPVPPSTPADAVIQANTLAYCASLKEVYSLFPGVACVACLYAESLMQHSPWKLWDLESGEPTPHANEARLVLEGGLRGAPHHPGLNHLAVHLLEMSPTPEAALPSCDVLRFHFPDAGHLIHMPSHIYVLLGMYDQAAACNLEAIIADDKYVAKQGIYNYYTGYRIHNIHFVSYAAMFAGQYDVAMDAARLIRKNLPDDLLANPIMMKYFEAFLSIEWHVLVRFGQWEEILSRSVVIDGGDDITCGSACGAHFHTIATQHYARGIAHAVLSGHQEKGSSASNESQLPAMSSLTTAEQELNLYRAACARVPADRVLHNNTCLDILKVGEAMLQGEILYRGGEYEAAFSSLQEAVRLSDLLVYDEPWSWMQPPRHALGALLLEQGRVAEAQAVFRKDMDRSFYGRCHPDNIWALSGLSRCLETEAALTGVETEAVSVLRPSISDGKEEKNEERSHIAHNVNQKNTLPLLDQSLLDPHTSHLVNSTTTFSPPSVEQELIQVHKKIEEIKAVARQSLLALKLASCEQRGDGRCHVELQVDDCPWLAEDVTVAACLCAQSCKQSHTEGGAKSE